MSEKFTCRRNSNLEIFLKRALPRVLFEDIRGYERCVVKSSRWSFTFQYVVLAGKALLLAPYPFRTTQLAVRLGDIHSIQVEHDFIDFLQEPERSTCQHIHIIYTEANNLAKKVTPLTEPASELTKEDKGEIELEETISADGIGGALERLSISISASPNQEERSLSSLLRRVVSDKPRVPRSSSAMDAHPERPVPSTTPQARSRSVMERLRPRKKHSPENPITLNLNLTFSTDLHIYVLDENSEFLPTLRRCWTTQLFQRTMSLTEASLTQLPVKDLKKLTCVYLQFKANIMDSSNAEEKIFHFLGELHLAFRRRPELKEIFWKDHQLYRYLVQSLNVYMKKSKRIRSSLEEEQHLLIQLQEEKLEFMLMVLKVLLASLRGTDNLDVKFQILKLERQLKAFLTVLVSPPRLENLLLNTCTRMLENYAEFSSSAWRNLPEAEVIKLVADVTNVASGILYEIMMSVERLEDNNPNLKISRLFKGISLDCYLRRAVTQLLALLTPTLGEDLKPEETITLYQHLYVLHCLMENLPEVLRYTQDHYFEEFRFYVQWSHIGKQISDAHPIKRLMEPIIHNIHQLILWRKPKMRPIME